MEQLKREDLLSLEDYSVKRDEFRTSVLDHKKNRRLQIGPAANLYFEDRLTIHYQIQEMLRIEKTFEAAGIEDELDAYNPLIPTGQNWKATFMLEYPDVEERRRMLANLVGIEDRVWVETEGQAKVYAIADEDLDRSTDDKTSAVHFLRFELPASFIEAVKSGSDISVGIDHENYSYTIDSVPNGVQQSLVQDLN